MNLHTRLAPPAGIDERSAQYFNQAVESGPIRDRSLIRIRDQYHGGATAVGPSYFPIPTGCDVKDWEEFRTLLTHVNFVRPATRTWVASVYGGQVSRKLVDNPHQDIMAAFIAGIEYDRAVRGWIENAINYGTAVAVPVLAYNGGPGNTGLDKEAELSIWLPNPIHTYIYTNPANVNDIEAVVEVKSDRVMFITKNGSGWATKDSSSYAAAEYDRVPCVIARGKDCTHMGEVYGESLVGDAAEWSIRATHLAMNISILQKLQTRATFVIYTDEEDPVLNGDHGPSKFLQMAKDARAEFMTPQPHIQECLSIMKSFIGLLSVASSIPADVLDSTLAESTTSAEAARIRAIPMLQQSGNMLSYWRHLEKQLVLTSTGVLEMAATRSPVNIRSLAHRVKTDVMLKPDVIPANANEKATTVIALHAAGLISDEDAIREVNQGKPDEQVQAMVTALEERRETASLQQTSQAAFKTSAAGKSNTLDT